MASAQSELSILVRLKDEASKSIEGIKGKLENMEPAFQKMSVAGGLAFGAITGYVALAIKGYADVERANRQLEYAIIGVSKGTKAQVATVNELTQSLEKKSGIDADALKMGVAQLSTFGLQSKSVVDLTKSLADLTVNQNGVNATSEQYIGSANVLAKALQGQFGVLEKSGIRFTETQQSMILYGTEAQKVSALQEGLNQNLRETTTTLSENGGIDVAMAKLKNSFGDIQDAVAIAFIPAMNSVIEKVGPLIAQFASWAEQNPQLVQTIIMVTAGLAGVVAIVGTLGLVLPSIIAGFTLLAGPVGIVIAILGTLILTVRNVVKIYQMLRDDGALIWEGIKLYMKEAVQWIYDNSIGPLIGWIDKARNALSALWESAKNTGGKVADKIGGAFSAPFSGRASGGSVYGGMPYRVGEKGPEIFVPTQNGSILPNGGGSTINLYISGNEFVGREGIAERIVDDITNSLKLRLKL